MRLKQEKKLNSRRQNRNLWEKIEIFRNLRRFIFAYVKLSIKAIDTFFRRRAIFARFLVFILIFTWIFSGWPRIWQNPPIPPKIQEAHAAAAYQAVGTAVAGTGAGLAPAWPTHAINDIALLLVEAAGGDAISLTTANGFVQVTNSPQATGTGTAGTRIAVYWARATSTSMAAPVLADSGDHTYAVILTYRGVIATGDPWDTPVGGVKAVASTSVTATGVTTTVANALVVVGVNKDLDAVAAFASAWTNGNLTGIAERFDAGTTQGGGGGIAVMDGTKATASATGNTTLTVTSSINAFLTIALKPAVTTISNFVTAEPSNSTIAPGASGQVDSFGLQTNGGSDTVTGATVTLASGMGSRISTVAITNDGDTTTYCSAAPSGDTATLTSCGIPVSNTNTQFKVKITAISHASMPVPPGGSYSVTGTVTAFTCTNNQSGSDSGSATVIIDNASPADVTGASGTAGDQQVSLSWTNPGDSDFHSTVVLRRANTAVGDTPVEGTTYIVGNTIGLSTVACVVLSPTASCTDTGLINGTPYHYKIFTRDNNVNYSTPGVIPTGSPFTPAAAGTLTVDIVDAGGTSVPSPSMAMGAVPFSFTYQTANGTFGVTDQKIRVNNTTASPQWTLTIAASSPTSLWSAGTPKYDFNDPTANAVDGGDADNYGGQMSINAIGATVTPKTGCTETGISHNYSNAFSEGVTNNITLLTADGTAGTNCYWDLTGVSVSQTIPASQSINTYTLDLTLTVSP